MTPTSSVSPAADRGVALLTLTLVLLATLSGCTSSSPPLPVVDAALGAPSADASDGGSRAVSAVVGGTRPPASEMRPVDTADSPWRHAPIVVGVDAPVDGRDYAPLVESTVDYRRVNASAVAYNPAFAVKPNSSDPGVTVSVVEQIGGCGDDVDVNAIDYAPPLGGDDPTTPMEPVMVVVAVGYDDGTTQTVPRHEFGHLLGLTHDDAGAFPVLSERVETTRLPEPDVGKRESPSHERTVAVYVDLSNVSFGEWTAHEARINHALSHYKGRANGVVPTNLPFECVSNPEIVDMTLLVSAFRDGSSGMCWRWTGIDADDDAALKWYTGGDLVVDADLVPSSVDWYVGAGLGYLSAADGRADLPSPPRDGGPANDRAWRGFVDETAGNVTTLAMTFRRTQEFLSVIRE